MCYFFYSAFWLTGQWGAIAPSRPPLATLLDALKIFTKSRTNEAENRQKIKNSQSLLKIYRFLKRRVFFDLFTPENF